MTAREALPITMDNTEDLLEKMYFSAIKVKVPLYFVFSHSISSSPRKE